MRRALADFKAYGRQFLRSKVGTFFTFGFPILLILLFGAIFSQTGSQKITLHIQDADGSPRSQGFIEALNATTFVNIEYIPSDADIEKYIDENSLSIALVIPEGFGENVTAGLANATIAPSAMVVLYGDTSNSNYPAAMSVISATIDEMNYGLSNTTRIIGLDMKSVAPEEYKYIDLFLPGVLGFTIMTTPMFAMANMCTEYRTRGYFKLLGSTPLTKSEWLVSKILWHMVVTYVSFAIMIVVGIAAFGLRSTLTVLAVVMIAVGVLLFTSLGMLIGSVTKNPETSAAITNAIMFPMMFLSGTFFPLESMPSYLQTIASVMPLTYVNQGLRDTMIYGNTGSALFNLAVVVVIAVVMFVAASRLMSWKKK